MEKVEIFGAIDRKEKKEDGAIVSTYPGWYLDRNLEDLQEGIDSRKRSIKRGDTPPEDVMRVKNEIKQAEIKYSEIIGSKPEMKGKVSDFLSEINKSMAAEITRSLFTREQMKKGLADVHEEARRMKTPFIKIDPTVARSFGVPCTKGMISRDGATQIWQMTQKLRGESTNVEILRRD